jgi:hypothetical protein
MCPWRDPDADLKQLFPEASRYEVETRILSGFRPELAQRLGRAPSADENALQVHRVFREADFVGNVMTRRVKGMYGAMELVIAADAQCRIARVLLQRIREPQAIADALQSVSWRERFKGKHAGSHWDSQELLAGLPAEAVVEGVRSGVVLLDVSGRNLPEHLAQTDSHPH